MVTRQHDQLLQPKRQEFVARWHHCPHYYYKPIDAWLVHQQLAAGKATGAKHLVRQHGLRCLQNRKQRIGTLIHSDWIYQHDHI